MTAREWREHLSRMWFGGADIPKGKISQLLCDMEQLEREIVNLNAYISKCISNTSEKYEQLENKIEELQNRILYDESSEI